MDPVPSLEILCCLQLWILPSVVEFIFLYVVRTMKCPWGQDCGYSEDKGGSALLNPKAFQHIRLIGRILWSWARSKSFCECPGTIAVLCLEGASFNPSPRMVKPLRNRVILAIIHHPVPRGLVLTGQKRNEKVEFRKSITLLRIQFFSRGENIRGQMGP